MGSWREIAITLIDTSFGEAKAQACDNAWFQQFAVIRHNVGYAKAARHYSAIACCRASRLQSEPESYSAYT
jgi:hypothetical protein